MRSVNNAVSIIVVINAKELKHADKLVEIGVKKTSSEEFSEFCDFDKSIVERFLRIIRNK